MLLESGATLGIEDGQLRTPLLLACESAAFDAVVEKAREALAA